MSDSNAFNPCFLVPTYNHSKTLPLVLDALSQHDYPVVVVDDGSQVGHSERIQSLVEQSPKVKLLKLNQNMGKGYAVIRGVSWAEENQFSHVIQVDSDAQHDLSQIGQLIKLAKEDPESLISGLPKYGDDIPKSRKYGRFLTHFWVWIETLSFKIKDSMCGFRVYPVKSFLNLVNRTRLGSRMEFDIEVLVRLFWAGTPVKYLPVKVSYPDSSVSHFDYIHDNIRISKLHTKLFFTMLVKAPSILLGRLVGQRGTSTKWSEISERGSLIGMRVLWRFYKTFGRKVCEILMLVPTTYYFIINRGARTSSAGYISRYKDHCKTLGLKPKEVSAFKHFRSFSNSMLDKFAAWNGDYSVSNIDFPHDKLYEYVKRGEGLFLISSHFGNIEVSRAIGQAFKDIQITILVYTKHAKKFNRLLNSIDSAVSINLIHVNKFGIDTVIDLKGRVDRGEWVVMMGDRVSVKAEERSYSRDFLGRTAYFPQGPFLLGQALNKNIFSLHVFREGRRFKAKLVELSEEDSRVLTKEERLNSMQDKYVSALESLVLEKPMQWFNFYDFWRKK